MRGSSAMSDHFLVKRKLLSEYQQNGEEKINTKKKSTRIYRKQQKLRCTKKK